MGKPVAPKQENKSGDKVISEGGTNPRVQDKVQEGGPQKATTYGKHAVMPVLAADNYAQVILPDLTEFNLDDIKLDGTIVAVGKRRTGKSWVFRNLMYHMKDKIPAGIVISQTDELNKFWRQYIPAKYIYPRYEPEILDAVFKRQKKILNDNSLTDEEKDKASDALFHVACSPLSPRASSILPSTGFHRAAGACNLPSSGGESFPRSAAPVGDRFIKESPSLVARPLRARRRAPRHCWTPRLFENYWLAVEMTGGERGPRCDRTHELAHHSDMMV